MNGNEEDLMGKRILITGASSGIGRAVALAAAARGADCVLVARRADELEKTRAAMARPDAHTVQPFDLAATDGIAAWFAELVAVGGPFAGLVHAAGVCPVMPVTRLDPAVLRSTTALNYYAFLALMSAFAKRGAFTPAGAAAVAVSSVSAAEGWSGGSVYCGSKGALSAACRALAVELAPKKIRVSVVEPRHVATPMFDACAARMGVPRSEASTPECVAEEILDQLTTHI